MDLILLISSFVQSFIIYIFIYYITKKEITFRSIFVMFSILFFAFSLTYYGQNIKYLLLLPIIFLFNVYILKNNTYKSFLITTTIYVLYVFLTTISHMIGIYLSIEILGLEQVYIVQNIIKIILSISLIISIKDIIHKVIDRLNDADNLLRPIITISSIILIILIGVYGFCFQGMYMFVNSIDRSNYMNLFFLITLTIITFLIVGIIYFINNYIYYKKKVKDIEERSKIDTMTKAFRREFGMKYLKKLISKGKENLIICYIDVNNLKVVNDTFGHQEGDKLLKKITETIRDNIRDEDFLVRLGGDEFLLIINEEDMKIAEILMENIVGELEYINFITDYNYNLSISYGFSKYNSNENITIQELINKADQSMYRHKKEMKNL